jgi:hypothetical protein
VPKKFKIMFMYISELKSRPKSLVAKELRPEVLLGLILQLK